MKILILIILLFASCSTLTERATSAEISIESAEKVLTKLPEGSDKEIIKIALSSSKKELKDYSKITKDLSKKKDKAVQIAQSKSETAGKWEGIRNVSLFVLGVFVIYVIIKFLNKFKGLPL